MANAKPTAVNQDKFYKRWEKYKMLFSIALYYIVLAVQCCAMQCKAGQLTAAQHSTV